MTGYRRTTCIELIEDFLLKSIDHLVRKQNKSIVYFSSLCFLNESVAMDENIRKQLEFRSTKKR